MISKLYFYSSISVLQQAQAMRYKMGDRLLSGSLLLTDDYDSRVLRRLGDSATLPILNTVNELAGDQRG